MFGPRRSRVMSSRKPTAREETRHENVAHGGIVLGLMRTLTGCLPLQPERTIRSSRGRVGRAGRRPGHLQSRIRERQRPTNHPRHAGLPGPHGSAGLDGTRQHSLPRCQGPDSGFPHSTHRRFPPVSIRQASCRTAPLSSTARRAPRCGLRRPIDPSTFERPRPFFWRNLSRHAEERTSKALLIHRRYSRCVEHSPQARAR